MTPNFRLWTLDFLFVFLVAFYLSLRHFALGIGAASFWSVSGKRYSGKPDGVAGTPKTINS